MTDVIGDEPQTFGVPGFPAFDANELRAAAGAWSAVAAGLRQTADAVQLQVNVLSDAWTGVAQQAFATEWSTVAGGIQELATEMDGVAAGLRRNADELEQLKADYDRLMIELGISVAVGVGLMFFTFGGSALLSAANAGRLVTRAFTIVKLAQAVSRFAFVAAGGSLRAIASRFAVSAAFTVGTPVAGNLIEDPHANPLRGIDPVDATLVSVIGVFLPFHKVGSTSVFRGAANSVTTDGLVQLYRTHRLDPGGLLFSGLSGGAMAKVPKPIGKEDIGYSTGGAELSDLTEPAARRRFASEPEPGDDGSEPADESGTTGESISRA
ncbi:WXG100 family type VII secretion target [Actinoplanes sp. LDG1-06]|uniref:WXG100 family type VII secretion target n=1 Tax=Paractinoplanes ovalisporus TaxID=2810368 RepID=A0ABS2ATS1_9ACTN|nr:WXG100 family type VII secretion target [Actinoplanes ovalisporus]MBM2623216.1 WXG100 family type VII secretion target [Actinoplanes ovalisporus]